MNRRQLFAAALALPGTTLLPHETTYAPSFLVNARGADAERVFASVPEAMQRAHDRAVATFLDIARRNGLRLT